MLGGEFWRRFLEAATAADQSVDVVMTAERLNFRGNNLLPEIIRRKKGDQEGKNKVCVGGGGRAGGDCNETFYNSEMLKS